VRRRLALLLAAAGLGLLAWGLWLPVKAALAQHLLERAWSRMQVGGEAVRPWPWADMHPAFRLVLPEVGEAFIVLDAASGEALAFGPGLVPRSAPPGEPGVTLVGAHRDTQFVGLRNVGPGDPLVVETVDGRRLLYRVRETAVVDSRAAGLRLDRAASLLVLSTCWPFDAVAPGGPLRFLVVADLVAP